MLGENDIGAGAWVRLYGEPPRFTGHAGGRAPTIGADATQEPLPSNLTGAKFLRIFGKDTQKNLYSKIATRLSTVFD